MALAHGGDRGLCWQALFKGARVGFGRGNTSIELLQDIREVKPTLFLGNTYYVIVALNGFMK